MLTMICSEMMEIAAPVSTVVALDLPDKWMYHKLQMDDASIFVRRLWLVKYTGTRRLNKVRIQEKVAH